MLQDIVQVQISLDTTGIGQQGFGVPIFIGSHRWFEERVRIYGSIEAAQADIPADSDEWKALTGFFSQTPNPSQVMIGRREADLNLTPTGVAAEIEYSITFTVGAYTETFTYEAVAMDDEEAVCTGLKNLIDGDPTVSSAVTATVNGTGAAATLDIAAQATFDFGVSNLSDNLVYSYSTTETAADVLTAITEENNDFYFITAHDHTETFVMAMAQEIEAREKIYFVSTDDSGSLSALNDPASDLLGKLYQGNFFRTVGLFHHEADNLFPETYFVAEGAPSQPGTITWSHKQLGGLSASRDPVSGKVLNATQLNNLSDRNANMIVTVGGVDIVRQGKVVGGEWIEKQAA